MHVIAKTALAALLATSLAGCGGSKPAENAAESPADSAAAPVAAPSATASVAADGSPLAFSICKSCHAVEKGKTIIGPSLAGIYGTKAGDVAGFSFSPALKVSGLTWDDATLDKWLENPMQLVPGTRMTYAGQSDPAKRKAMIEYIKTLK